MNNQTLPLPLDLIREILLRLPVRSVLRFKCVCKSWRSLISDSQFGISHYDLAAAPSHRILLRSNDFYIESIDIDAPQLIENSAAVLFLLPPTSPPYHCEFDYYADHHDKHEILGSCRGLVVLYYNRTDDLVLWNPSIGAYIRLPDFEFDLTSQFFLYGFGYDASKDDYLLVVIELFGSGYADADFHVCSFITEPWRWERSRLDFPYKNLDDSFKAGSLLNGALHWLVLSKDKKVPVIIAFDMIEGSLSEIPLLDHLTMEKCQVYSLRVMGGCVSVCCSIRGCEMDELWVMKEYKVQSSWTKSIVIPTYGFSPICITKDGGIFGSNLLGILVKLNDKGELLQHLAYGRTQKLYQANLQCAMYRESLLSLPSVTTHCGKQVKMTSSNKLGKIGL